MTSIGIYIIFIAVLAGYRSSRYWPSSYKGMAWLGNHLWHLMSMLTGTLLLVITSGWAVGLLTSVCTYITLLSCTIFIVNCNRWIQITGVVLFHLSCIIGLILHF